MRLLILSFYYAPDLSAGSFRATALVAALREQVPSGTHIEVVTSLPNRYKGFAHDAQAFERDGDVEIHRIALPEHRSDMFGQSLAFRRFAAQALRHVDGRHYDLVFATSSRLMTAALGAWIARRKRAPLYLDIRDIFVDTIADVLPRWAAWPAKPFFSTLERWTMRRARRINLVSGGFEEYFRARYPHVPLSAFTNGIDPEFAAPPEALAPKPTHEEVTILYAGNIGEGQGLHYILPGLARELRGRARFVVVGDGGRREALQKALAESQVTNVELHPPEPRSRLIARYRDADVLFLHLNAHAAFEKVLPSKLFEYAALRKPILAGVAGYAARFVRTEISNAAVFAPCDVSGAVRAFATLQLHEEPRTEFVRRFLRLNIMRAMAGDVLAAGARP